ncbi:hypothetical protein QTO34_002145 [Cnephaeus nilssonii]|uniref:Uncharacterized protein n=1 Tax=Cnephaeus nilssonii TaxID=3371016 RepID=A0AA40LN47_CNENI|nr:hypothetical protein QTO34_002145 [Eptesicus nilssonii]
MPADRRQGVAVGGAGMEICALDGEAGSIPRPLSPLLSTNNSKMDREPKRSRGHRFYPQKMIRGRTQSSQALARGVTFPQTLYWASIPTPTRLPGARARALKRSHRWWAVLRAPGDAAVREDLAKHVRSKVRTKASRPPPLMTPGADGCAWGSRAVTGNLATRSSTSAGRSGVAITAPWARC